MGKSKNHLTAFPGKAGTLGALRLASALALGTGLLLGPGAAWAVCGKGRPTVSYQAKKTITQGEVSVSAVTYATAEMERHEPAGMTEVLIYRYDKQVEWMLLPEFKKFSEIELAEDPEEYMESEPAGEGTLNGEPVLKCKFSAVYPDGGTEEGTMWINDENVVLKREGTLTDPQGEIAYSEELSDYKVVDHAPTLFAVPEDYDPNPIMIQGLGTN